MENCTDIISSDFNQCKTTEDYEKFVLKYNASNPRHPLLTKAKEIISQNAKVEATKFHLPPAPIVILGGLALIAAGIWLTNISLGYDGEDLYTTYHGEHADIKMTDLEVFFGGPVSGIGGLALCGGGLYFTIVGIVSIFRKKK